MIAVALISHPVKKNLTKQITKNHPKFPKQNAHTLV